MLRKWTFQTARRMAVSARAASTATAVNDSGLPDIVITPLAAKKLNEVAEKQKIPNMVLRVAVEGGGCSGFQYVYEFERDDNLEEEDILYEQNGGRVVVDSESLEFLRGSTIDFEQELIRSAFAVVNNPNAVGGCGCGTSFELKE